MAEESVPDREQRPPGVERRRQPDRRSGDERREEIRYEPDKGDRRSHEDRRGTGWDGTLIR